jgi:hemerythrin-like metal-binding protein
METKHPELLAQKQQHQVFLDKVSEFKTSFENGETALAVKMLPFLNDWFLNHIMKVDMKYK